MISRRFAPFKMFMNFFGVNARDTDENMLDGEWDEASIDIMSDPQGSVGMRRGFTGLTSASIGSVTAWCGFYHYKINSTNADHFLGGADDGKLYKFATNAYSELGSGYGSEDDDDRFRFTQIDDLCIIADGANTLLKYSGSGSVATLGGTAVTSDFAIEAWQYLWAHSTVDKRLMYYCTTSGSAESGFTSFLNFDEDPYTVTGASKQGDDMLVFKLWSIFRVVYTGITPKFKKYRVDTKIGAVNHDVIKELPDGSVIFAAPDFNIYIAKGNEIVPVGENIQPYIKAGVNSRLAYAVAGLNYNRSQYYLSFTYNSGVTTNDRTIVMDWSRPYQNRWGKLQFPWFIYSMAANCFAEAYVSGKSWIYHGGYVGKMYKGDTGTNDDGVAIVSNYRSKLISMGDSSLEKKYSKLMMVHENKGAHNLDITLTCDDNANTQKLITQSMTGGLGYQTLWGVGKWGEDYWSSEVDADVGRDIGRTGKLIRVNMGTDGVDEDWNISSFQLLAKPLRRGTVRTRES